MNARTRSSASDPDLTGANQTGAKTTAPALWIAEPCPPFAVAQCQDGAAHAVAVRIGSGAAGAAAARRRRAGWLESSTRRSDPAAARRDGRRAGRPAAGDAFAGADQRAATPAQWAERR